MDAMRAILSRRSIRQYKPEPVPDELITELLQAAMSAPSAKNERPWHFIVIKDREMLDVMSEIHQYASMFKDAPMAIAVCADTQIADPIGYWVQDCSAATENLLLAAHARKLGAVWTGVYPRKQRTKDIQNLLGLPPHVIPLSLVALGYPLKKKRRPADRYNPERVHYNRW